MAPKKTTKGPQSKRARGESSAGPPQGPTFTVPMHSARHYRLRGLTFGEARHIDWDALRQVGLAADVQRYLGVGAWDRLLALQEPTYRELTLEVLATLTVERGLVSFHRDTQIQFQMFGTMHQMSVTTFAAHLGLYDPDFIASTAYSELRLSRPTDESPESAWQRLSTDAQYDPRRSKASTLRSPALRYIHMILSHSITGRGLSTGVVSRRDFLYLQSMADGFHLHLGWVVAEHLSHQATDPRIHVLFAGPYITRLARGMELLTDEHISGMQIVGHSIPVTIERMRAMGMLQVTRTPEGTRYTLSGPTEGQEQGTAAGSSSAPPPPRARPPAPPTSPAVPFTEHDRAVLHWTAGAVHYLIQQAGGTYPPPPQPPALARDDSDDAADGDGGDKYQDPMDEFFAP